MSKEGQQAERPKCAPYRDVLYHGKCDAGVRELSSLCGWSDDLDQLVRASAKHTPSTNDELDKILHRNAEVIAETAPSIDKVNAKWKKKSADWQKAHQRRGGPTTRKRRVRFANA